MKTASSFVIVMFVSFLICAHGSAASRKCKAGKSNVLAPHATTPIFREQVNASLALQGRYPSPSGGFINWTKAFEAPDWNQFAAIIGTQDFSYTPIYDSHASSVEEGEYLHLDYGLGDNDFGSIHLLHVVAPLISIDDGDWHRVPGVTRMSTGLLRCLEGAEDRGVTPLKTL